ncbi:unnamed protein product [Penicillium salamii]|uniref:F-box domain-containing protein n=1 Tax=Penicillium salamii TaxID=1612424 RepID=A0A9W4NPD2_9EURO|nr:unnamed protein product [Penicillium salamii]
MSTVYSRAFETLLGVGAGTLDVRPLTTHVEASSMTPSVFQSIAMKQTILSRMWQLRKRTPKALRKEAPILLLPNVLISKILAYLLSIDRVCLSLTCKRFQFLIDAAQSKELKFPRLLKIKNPRLCVNKASTLRNQLLLRIETSSWLYCGVCLKLHLRKVFSRPFVPSIYRRCSDNAGIVDLCPCISLTAADRRNIIRFLSVPGKFDKLKAQGRYIIRRFTAKNTPNPQISLDGRFAIREKDGLSYLTHGCCERAKYWKTSLQLLVFIDGEKLVVQAEYRLDSQRLRRRNWLAEPVFACPHKNLTLLAGYLTGARMCTECDTLIEGTSRRNENPATISTQRVLGGIEESQCSAWLRQSRFTDQTYDQYLIYWRDAAAIILERKEKRAKMKKYLDSTKPSIELGQSIVLKPVLKRSRSLPLRFMPGKVVTLADLK